MDKTKQASRKGLALPVLLGTACLWAGGSTAPAYAYVAPAGFGAIFGCASQHTLTPLASPAGLEGGKSSAILAGQPSALDLIIAQQAGDAATSVSYAAEQRQPAALAQMLPCPVAAPNRTTAIEMFEIQALPSEDFLGSSRVFIGSTLLDQAWRRVSTKSAPAVAKAYFAKKPWQSDFAYVEKVNMWVNHNIDFFEDKALYGQSDYWATAAETLRLRKGDCEDFAILKYQFLVNSGIDPASIYLSLVWDAVRRRDHAVLIVKLDGSYYLLDNETDQVLPADASHEYLATLSFSENSSWVHGYTARPDALQTQTNAQLAYFSDKAVSKALATGFSR